MTVVDELGIVLEAYTRGLEEGLEKATKKTKEFEEQTEESSLKMLEAIAKQEAMVSSLNQVAGGYAKTTAAAKELGFVNEEQEKALNKVRFAFELVSGPMEIYIAFSKLSTVVNFAEAKSKLANASATGILTGAATALNAAFMANPIGFILVSMIAVTLAVIALENKFGLATTAVRYMGEAFDILADKLKFVTDGLQGATMMAAELGDALAFGPVSGLLNTLGGR
tara:strand:+ start:393 stop:1067 length:675 start_codon:yes stop_codon:yes gene_type:complete